MHIEKTNIEGKIDRLTDLLVDGHIQEGIYKQKHKELSKRLNEITYEAEGNTVGNLKFKESLSNIVCLLSNSRNLFESSHVDEKRKLLGFVFENLALEGPTLRFSLRKPFELLADLPNNPEWRPLRPVNHNFSVYWETELTNNYPYFIGFFEGYRFGMYLSISSWHKK